MVMRTWASPIWWWGWRVWARFTSCWGWWDLWNCSRYSRIRTISQLTFLAEWRFPPVLNASSSPLVSSSSLSTFSPACSCFSAPSPTHIIATHGSMIRASSTCQLSTSTHIRPTLLWRQWLRSAMETNRPILCQSKYLWWRSWSVA